MGDKYQDYLAARVLVEGQPVTYRLLSRALKANVNIAKRMLYDFYEKQNAKKPRSVHATYLLVGKKRIPEQTNGSNGHDGEDVIMQSSPPFSSMPEQEEERAEEPLPTTSIVLLREEELEAMKLEFEEITSIHIYSLEPGPLENMNLLSICNQEIVKDYSAEDPLDRWRLYGSSHNPYVKRRTTKYAPQSVTAISKPAPAPALAPTPATSKARPAKGEMESDDNASGRSTPQPSTNVQKQHNSKPSLKREKSDIFKSFAKSKPKREETPEPMQGMSEDEEDIGRAERAEKLRKMMEDDPEEEISDGKEAIVKMDIDGDETAVEEKPDGGEPAVTVQGGRRRGRRRVMKKKKVQDQDGYLVTKEEAVWESFSEDEPEPKKPKTAPKARAPAANKKGQGSIASFFKKS